MNLFSWSCCQTSKDRFHRIGFIQGQYSVPGMGALGVVTGQPRADLAQGTTAVS